MSPAMPAAFPPGEASPSCTLLGSTPALSTLSDSPPTHCQNVSLLLSRSSSTPLPGLAEVTVHTAVEEVARRAERQCEGTVSPASHHPTRLRGHQSRAQPRCCALGRRLCGGSGSVGAHPASEGELCLGKAKEAKHALLVGASAPLGTAKRGTFI